MIRTMYSTITQLLSIYTQTRTPALSEGRSNAHQIKFSWMVVVIVKFLIFNTHTIIEAPVKKTLVQILTI
jgi:hypothetical protein